MEARDGATSLSPEDASGQRMISRRWSARSTVWLGTASFCRAVGISLGC